MIKISNLVETYGSHTRAVDNLNLEIKSGEIFGFIGHNGAGKTTTIKAITGILNFEQGEILIDGKSIKKEPLACKKIMAYIPDNPDLYEMITGLEYINFVADVFNISKIKRKDSIENYAKLFGIYDNLNDAIASYSHGMKQKLSIIAALIHDPKIIIMDEPFVGLDPYASHNLKQIMKELTAKGCCIFFSTHVLEVAEKLCDRIGIIKDGKLILEGKTEDITKDKSLEDVFMGQI